MKERETKRQTKRGPGDGPGDPAAAVPGAARAGAWPSPLESAAIVRDQIGLIALARLGNELWWSETRPLERGRSALVRSRDGASTPVDVLPAPFSARTRVHEYGGGAWALSPAGLVLSNEDDRRVWHLAAAGGQPRALTPPGAWRFADFSHDPIRQRWFAVREDHSSTPEPSNTLVQLDVAGESVGTILVGDRDFVSNPRVSPDGRRLAWLAWDHPSMPWDGCELWLAELRPDGTLADARQIAGGDEESIFQPEWSPDGTLVFVSDRSGFWNLESFDGTSRRPLHPHAADFGRPQWAFGLRTFAFADAQHLVCSFTEAGRWQLGMIDLVAGGLRTIPGPWVAIDDLVAMGDRAWLIASSETAAQAIFEIDLRHGTSRILYAPTPPFLAIDAISRPQHLELPGRAGRRVYVHLYPPMAAGIDVPTGERPPLRVKSHGGPTGAARPGFDPTIQYWTSRGWLVADVDYAGSTGYGRAFRNALRGGWGVVDVEDCVDVAKFLASEGWVDPARLTISGRSAGGYTTLCALTFHDVFCAGTCAYGVGDLATLAADTHKFESRYTDRLVAPFADNAELWRARSPLHHVDRLSRPVLFLHGLEDRVVPVAQTQSMVEALRARGVSVELLLFEGEGHGFRRPENQQRALEAELAFLQRWT